MAYSSGILAKEIGSAIQKIDEWLGKPVVITCNEVTSVQLPRVIEHICQTTGIESVVFNTGIDEMKSASNLSVYSRYHSYAGGPAVLGALGITFLNKTPGIPPFLVQSKRKTLLDFSSGFMLSQMPERTSKSN